MIESNQTLLCLIHHVAKPWMRLEVLLLHDVVAHAPHDLMLTKRAGACMKSTTGAHKTHLVKTSDKRTRSATVFSGRMKE